MPKICHINHEGASKTLVLVDEKTFTVDAEVNRKNSHIIAYDPFLILSLMVFGAAESDGSVKNPDFVASGLKIASKNYLDIFKYSLLT